MKSNPRLLGKKLQAHLDLEQLLFLDVSELDRKEIIRGWARQANSTEAIEAYLKIDDLNAAVKRANKLLSEEHVDAELIKFCRNQNIDYEQKVFNKIKKLTNNGDAFNRGYLLGLLYAFAETDSEQKSLKEKISKVIGVPNDSPIPERSIKYLSSNPHKYLTLLKTAIENDELYHTSEISEFFKHHHTLKEYPEFNIVLKNVINYCIENKDVTKLKEALDNNIPSVTKEMVREVAMDDLTNSLDVSAVQILGELCSESELSNIANSLLENLKTECSDNSQLIRIPYAIKSLYLAAKDSSGLLDLIYYLKSEIKDKRDTKIKSFMIIHLADAFVNYVEIAGKSLPEKEWRELINLNIELDWYNPNIIKFKKGLFLDLLLKQKQKLESENKLFLARLIDEKIKGINKDETKS